MSGKTVVVGIDPDVDTSGVAFWDKKTRQLRLGNESFFDLYEILLALRDNISKVVVEAGWLNKKSNWHHARTTVGGDVVRNSMAVNEAISKKTGANHEAGRKIVEMCKHLGIEVEERVPRSSKVDSSYFCKLTGVKSSNQEQRDAAMLVFGS